MRSLIGQGEYQAGLLRLKGLVWLNDGIRATVQWSVGDGQASIEAVDPSLDLSLAVPNGLTVIVEKDFYSDARTALIRAFEQD